MHSWDVRCAVAGAGADPAGRAERPVIAPIPPYTVRPELGEYTPGESRPRSARLAAPLRRNRHRRRADSGPVQAGRDTGYGTRDTGHGTLDIGHDTRDTSTRGRTQNIGWDTVWDTVHRH